MLSNFLDSVKNNLLKILSIIFLLSIAILPFLASYFSKNKNTDLDIPKKCIQQYKKSGAIPATENCVRTAVSSGGGMGGYHCTGSKGLEWSKLYCNGQLATSEQRKEGVVNINYDGIPNFDSNHLNYHDYTVVNSCQKTEPNCNRQQIFEKLKQYPAPLASGKPVSDEDTSYAWPVGYVRHEVNEAEYVVTNVTLDMHLLATGTVERRVIEDDFTVSIKTRGQGTGLFPKTNIALSDPLWSWVDGHIFE